MRSLKLLNRTIEKTGKWERRTIYHDDRAFSPAYLERSHGTITYAVSVGLGVLFIGAPFFGGLLILSWLPVSNTVRLLCAFTMTLIMTVTCITILVIYARRKLKNRQP